jgi:hypothetical protein
MASVRFGNGSKVTGKELLSESRQNWDLSYGVRSSEAKLEAVMRAALGLLCGELTQKNPI